jgi:hypothetical protein
MLKDTSYGRFLDFSGCGKVQPALGTRFFVRKSSSMEAMQENTYDDDDTTLHWRRIAEVNHAQDE